MHQEPSRGVMRSDAAEEGEKSSWCNERSGASLAPVSLGELLTTPPTLTSTESRPAGRERERDKGQSRWRSGEQWQIGGEGVMSLRGEDGMTGSGGGAEAG